jgi:hypothetical protein
MVRQQDFFSFQLLTKHLFDYTTDDNFKPGTTFMAPPQSFHSELAADLQIGLIQFVLHNKVWFCSFSSPFTISTFDFLLFPLIS